MSAAERATFSDPVDASAAYNVSVAQAYRAWTDPAALTEWFGPNGKRLLSAQTDVRVGGAWRFVFAQDAERRDILRGIYTAVEPERCLAFTWAHVKEFADGRCESSPETHVAVTFTALGVGTRIDVVHHGLGSEEVRRQVSTGWGAALARLQARWDGALAP